MKRLCKRVFSVVLLAVLSGCNLDSYPHPIPGLSVYLVSTGGVPDMAREIFTKVVALVKADKNHVSAEVSVTGLEGERLLCATYTTAEAAANAVKNVVDLIGSERSVNVSPVACGVRK